MEWVKKNPVIVAGASVAVVLIALAGWFLFSKVSASSETEAVLLGLLDNRRTMWESRPFPGEENIAAIRKDLERVAKFQSNLQTVIPPMPAPANLDDRGLKVYLEQTIADLFLAATNSKTAIIQPNYSFGFSALRKKLTYKTNTYDVIALQLADIRMLLGILFDSKINALEGVRRSSLTLDDESGGPDYFFLKPITNQFSVITPYELQFRCFGSELESVIQGLVEATNCIVIKNINVSPSRASVPNPDVMVMISEAAQKGSISIGLKEINAATKPVADASTEGGRYNPSRYRVPPGTVYTPASAPAGIVDTNKPVTVLSEKPLRVTVLLDIVRTLRP